MTATEETASSTEDQKSQQGQRYILTPNPQLDAWRPPPGEILAEPLRRLLRTLLFSVTGGIALLFCAGFKPKGFELPEAVLIAIVGGISAQYIVSAIPALSSGIADITRAYYDYRSKSSSTTALR